jgi:Fur family transcriptional regulator, ferric uptake regulator
LSQAQAILKKANLKVTSLRKDVIEIIYGADHAVKSTEIEQQLGDFDRITLYRTLKSFEEKGLVHKINGSDGSSLYGQCHNCNEHEHNHHESHLHFQCDICNKTFCIDNVAIPSFQIPGYEVKGQNIILTGRCKEC